MKKSDFNSIIISFVLAMIGTIYAYFNASTNPLFGLPIIALLIITFLVSFILLFMIFKYLVFGLILSKKEIIPSKDIPKATSNVTNTFVPGSTAPQIKPAPIIKPQTFVKEPEPIKEKAHEDMSLIVENITEPLAVSEKKKSLVIDNTIDNVKDEERKVRRDEIVKESEATTLVDLGSGTSEPKTDDKDKESDAPKFRKLTSFEDVDNK